MSANQLGLFAPLCGRAALAAVSPSDLARWRRQGIRQMYLAATPCGILTWLGRGRRPRWVADSLAKGMALSELVVDLDAETGHAALPTRP